MNSGRPRSATGLLHRLKRTLCVVITTVGCASGDAPKSLEQAPRQLDAPLGAWVRVPLGAAADSLLWRSVRNVAVAGSGEVLIMGDFATVTDDGLLGNLFIPGADTIVRFGRAGEGPGEFSGLNIVIGETDGFSIASLGRQVLVQVDSRGAVRGEQRIELFTSALLATSAQGIDVQSLRPAQSADAPVVTRQGAKREPRVLVTAADLVTASPDDAPAPLARSLLPYGTNRRGDRIAFMLPGGYHIEERNLASGEVVRIDCPAPVHVAGIDDPGEDWRLTAAGVSAVDALAQRLPCASPRILLVHRPDVFAYAARAGFDVVLAGHYHGGQIALPGSGGRLNPARLLSDWFAGTHRIGKCTLHVSRGVGCTGPRLRVACAPEFSLIELAPAGDEDVAPIQASPDRTINHE